MKNSKSNRLKHWWVVLNSNKTSLLPQWKVNSKRNKKKTGVIAHSWFIPFLTWKGWNELRSDITEVSMLPWDDIMTIWEYYDIGHLIRKPNFRQLDVSLFLIARIGSEDQDRWNIRISEGWLCRNQQLFGGWWFKQDQKSQASPEPGRGRFCSAERGREREKEMAYIPR